ncbi:MAG: HAD family hydrolase [Saprospiraceae bacterium]|nr:HAD family hydrolase [Saprospiraceae bacterium]
MVPKPDRSWTLFLDRDGVINRRIPGHYVKSPDEFHLQNGVEQAIASFNLIFGRVVVVTNQAGIGKGLMTEEDLQEVHKKLSAKLRILGARIDYYFHCPDLPDSGSPCRKPATGMAMQAQASFPEIDFQKSIVVGDSLGDIQFGKSLQMYTVLVAGKEEEEPELADAPYDMKVDSLFEFAEKLNENGEI